MYKRGFVSRSTFANWDYQGQRVFFFQTLGICFLSFLGGEHPSLITGLSGWPGEHLIDHVGFKKLSRTVSDLVQGRPASTSKPSTMFVGCYASQMLGTFVMFCWELVPWQIF